MSNSIVRLEDLFGAVLDVSPASLTDTSSPADVKTWDSFGHISLIAAMEETYGVAFKTTEIQATQSLGAARRLLRQKGVTV